MFSIIRYKLQMISLFMTNDDKLKIPILGKKTIMQFTVKEIKITFLYSSNLHT